MNKLAVNNYIVSMRKSVKQARVRIINKLVRQVRKLKEKKGSEEQKLKNQRKAERLLQELVVIKKINRDDVSKYALMCSEDVSKILRNDTLCGEEKAKARFAANEIVASKVKEFRDLYPEWEIKLPVVLTQLGIQYKQKKKQKQTAPKLKVNGRKKSDETVLLRGEGISGLNGTVRNSENLTTKEKKQSFSDSDKRMQNQGNEDSPDEEELDDSQRFRFILRNPDIKSGESGTSSSEDGGNNTGQNGNDDVRNRRKMRKKTNGVAEITRIRDTDRDVESRDYEIHKTSAVLDNNECNDSVNKTNFNTLSKCSNQRFGDVRHDDNGTEKSLDVEECGKFKKISTTVMGCKLPIPEYENVEKVNYVGKKMDSNEGKVKGEAKKIAGVAEIRKFSELLKETNKKTEYLKEFTLLDESELVKQKEIKKLRVMKKEESAPYSENTDNSGEKLANKGVGKVRDSFFLTGNDSESETDDKSVFVGDEQIFKKQGPFGKQCVIRERRTRIGNGRAFQKNFHPTGRSGPEKLNNIIPEENVAWKEVSGGVSEQNCGGKTETVNEVHKRLLGLASYGGNKSTFFEKSKPYSENSDNSREISVNKEVEKVRDSYFMTGDDSESKNGNKSTSVGEEQQYKMQGSFGKQHVISKRNTRIGNGVVFQKNSHPMGGARPVKLNNLVPEENVSWKDVSGGTGEQNCGGNARTLNEMQKKLLALTSPVENEPTLFVKSSLPQKERPFPSSRQPRHLNALGAVPMNRKLRRLLEHTSSGAAAEEAGKKCLHPSWEAKRQQKVHILPFQGTKIKFDDD